MWTQGLGFVLFVALFLHFFKLSHSSDKASLSPMSSSAGERAFSGMCHMVTNASSQACEQVVGGR